MSEGAAVRSEPDLTPTNPPGLLCELEPWHRTFLRNLGDFMLRREPPPLELTAEPVPVAPDKFIRTGIDSWRFAESGAYHLAVLTAVYFLSTLPFHHALPLQSPFRDTKVEYYPLSDYLPPINTGKREAVKSRKGEPKMAKQEILSVPPEPDNKRQTIITPPKVKLQQDVALPNIVAWTPVPAQQPIAASARQVSKLTIPQFEVPVVEPAADVSKVHAKLQAPLLQPTVVQPAADVSQVQPKLTLPVLPQPSVVEPPLSADQLKLKSGQINMAQLQPTLTEPRLPVEPQRASGQTDTNAQPGKGTAPNAPAQPSVANLAGNSRSQGQLIALGLNPADVRGPISAPNGSRSGEFHASPGGTPDASGTPNIVGSGNASDASGGKGNANGAPPGIMVGAPPPGATTSGIAGTTPKSPATTNADSEARKRIIAAVMNPTLPNVNHSQPPPPPPVSNIDDPSIEQRVFGNRPYYSVILNMPNLTSATGSWIIRYAELKQNKDKTTLTAPVATIKVDPAYPPDVLRDHVEGIVILYAVIHTDGSVTNIRVLDSLDDRLDQNAMRALSRWHFQPGTKNGAPVDIEAVVQIPFRMKHPQ